MLSWDTSGVSLDTIGVPLDTTVGCLDGAKDLLDGPGFCSDELDVQTGVDITGRVQRMTYTNEEPVIIILKVERCVMLQVF